MKKTLLIFCFILCISFVFADLSVSDLGIDFGGGNITDPSHINLRAEPLLIMDKARNAPVAIFNANSSFIFDTAFSLGPTTFPNTSTGFLGDVNNFDNTNNFSRFKETNLNDGVNASAGFIGENDIGHTLSFGIGSENFEFMGLPLANIGALRLNAPSDMFFVNDFITGWFWVSDQNDTPGITDPRAVMHLSAEGNLNITGNFTGSQFYGQMFFFNITDAETIIINETGIDNFFNITGMTPGEVNGFTIENSSLITEVAGVYEVEFSISYQDSAGNRHVVTLLQNGEFFPQTSILGFTQTATTIASVASSGFLRVEEGDRLQLGVADVFGGASNIDVFQSQFNLVRIGD